MKGREEKTSPFSARLKGTVLDFLSVMHVYVFPTMVDASVRESLTSISYRSGQSKLRYITCNVRWSDDSRNSIKEGGEKPSPSISVPGQTHPLLIDGIVLVVSVWFGRA